MSLCPTTVAGKAVLHPRSDLTTFGANFAGVGRNSEQRCNVVIRDLVGYEVLQLAQRPAMQPRAHAQTRLDALANVGKVFHRDSAPAEALGLCNGLPSRGVVDVTHVSSLLARDLPQKLFGASRAVGLKTARQGKTAITFVTKLPAAPNLARISGSEVVLSDVQSKDGAEGFEFDLLLSNEVKEPLSLAGNQLGFLRPAPGKQSFLVLAGSQRDGNAPGERIERELVPPHGECARVEMHAGAAEVDFRDRFVLRNSSVRVHRTAGTGNRPQDVAAHLRSERHRGATATIGQTMQVVSVPTARFDDDRNEHVAGSGIGGLQGIERDTLGVASLDRDRGRALCRRSLRLFLSHGHLSPLFLLFGTLDVPADGLRTHIAGCADIVGWGSEIAGSQSSPKRRKRDERFSRRRPLRDCYRVNGDRWREGEKQVNVIRLDFLGDYRPGVFQAQCIKKRSNRQRDTTHEHVAPIPRAIAIALPSGIAWATACHRAKCNLAFLRRLRSPVCSEEFL
jgi:hypothetical protein